MTSPVSNGYSSGTDSRVHFVCGISPYHVFDCQFSSRVEFDPGIKSQHLGVEDDDGLTIGNHALDFPSAQLILFGPSRDE